MASPLGYGLLGFFTGPIGGVVAGYLYAQKENRIALLTQQEPTKSEFFSAAIGLLLGSIGIGGAYYGYQLAKTENRLDAISHESTGSIAATNNQSRSVSPQQEIAVETSKWRDNITSSQALASAGSITR